MSRPTSSSSDLTPLLIFLFRLVEFGRCLLWHVVRKVPILKWIAPVYRQPVGRTDAPRSCYSVIVTGASSGIGADLSIELAKLGFVVFATVRHPEDGEQLCGWFTQSLLPRIIDADREQISIRKHLILLARSRKIMPFLLGLIVFWVDWVISMLNYCLQLLPIVSEPVKPGKIIPVQLDVTKEASISMAVDRIRRLMTDNDVPMQLVGIVNNAGCATAAPVELATMTDVAKIMETNFLGALRVTRAFLPLLRGVGSSRERSSSQLSNRSDSTVVLPPAGRIIFLSSIAGQVPFPGGGIYSASKHALEAMASSLRMELNSLSQPISVSIIEPSVTRTRLWRKSSTHVTGDVDLLDIYQPAINEIHLRQSLQMTAMKPWWTSQAIIHALTSPFPKERYLVGLEAYVVSFLQFLLPERLFYKLIESVYRYNMNKSSKMHHPNGDAQIAASVLQ